MRRVLLIAVALLILSSPLAPSAAAASDHQASVINGLEASQGSFPYMALVVFEKGTEGDLCSGTLVSSNVVLTAAHCVMNSTFTVLHNPANFVVVTGAVDWASAERTLSSVSRVAVDPDLEWLTPSDIPFRGDAAVLQLSQPVTAPAVRLATTETWTPGTTVTMVGWGLTTADGEPPQTLHVGETAVQGAGYCTAHFSHFQSTASLCTLDSPDYRHAVCNGDSGGPLLMPAPGTNEPLEVGITSFGSDECSTEAPQYFTRADYVAPWVDQKVSEWAPAPPTPQPTPTASAPQTTQAVTTLPRMTKAAAETYARRGLTAGLGRRFNRRSSYTIRCASVASASQRCYVSWDSSRSFYYGQITIYYLLEDGKAVWRDRYRVHRAAVPCNGCRRVLLTG